MSYPLGMFAFADLVQQTHVLLGAGNYYIETFSIQPIEIDITANTNANIRLGFNNGAILATDIVANPGAAAAGNYLLNTLYVFPVKMVVPRGLNISVTTLFNANVTRLIYSIQLYGATLP